MSSLFTFTSSPLNSLSKGDGVIYVGDGSNVVAESGSDARTSLGLGSASTGVLGTGNSNVVQLDSLGRLPAVDASLLTNIPDNDTRISLDLLGDDTIESTSITGIITAGDTNNIFTESVPDRLTINVGSNWPTADNVANSGSAATLNTGTGVNDVIIGSDSRLTDNRTPISHASSHQSGGSDEINVGSLSGVLAQDQKPFNSISKTSGNFYVGNGTDIVARTPSQSRTELQLGTAATGNIGTGSNNLVQLDGLGRLPAIDGSQLTNITDTDTKIILDFGDDGADSSATTGIVTSGDTNSIFSQDISNRLLIDLAKNWPTADNVANSGSAAGLNVGTSGNNIVQLDSDGKLPAIDGSNLTNLDTGSSTSDAMTLDVTQTSHGLSVQNLVRLNSVGNYIKALADSDSNQEVIGIVSSVTDTNNFTISLPGSHITGLTGLTSGTLYFLSDSVSGAMVTTAPTISKPVLVAITDTKGIFVNYRGIQGGGASSNTVAYSGVTGVTSGVIGHTSSSPSNAIVLTPEQIRDVAGLGNNDRVTFGGVSIPSGTHTGIHAPNSSGNVIGNVAGVGQEGVKEAMSLNFYESNSNANNWGGVQVHNNGDVAFHIGTGTRHRPLLMNVEDGELTVSTGNATSGHVYTCQDSNGKGKWQAPTSGSALTVSSIGSGNTNAVANTIYIVDASSAGATITLPSSHNSGDIIGFKAKSTGTGINTITLARNGNNIDNVGSDITTTNEMDYYEVISDGTDWWIRTKYSTF